MTLLNWPDYLPQNVTDGGFSYTPTSNTLTTNMEHGYAKVRKRTTKVYKIYTISFEMTQEQFYDFETFFEYTIGFGVLSFNMFDPMMIEDSIECMIVAGAQEFPYSVSPIGGSEDLLVSFKIEIIE